MRARCVPSFVADRDCARLSRLAPRFSLRACAHRVAPRSRLAPPAFVDRLAPIACVHRLVPRACTAFRFMRARIAHRRLRAFSPRAGCYRIRSSASADVGAACVHGACHRLAPTATARVAFSPSADRARASPSTACDRVRASLLRDRVRVSRSADRVRASPSAACDRVRASLLRDRVRASRSADRACESRV